MKEASLLFFCRKTKVLFRGRFSILPETPPLPKRCFFNPPRPSFAKEGAFRSTPSLLSQGGLHILTKPSLLEGKDVTALRCSEPLRSKVGGASKPAPCFAGWDRLGTACFWLHCAWGLLASGFIAPGDSMLLISRIKICENL